MPIHIIKNANSWEYWYEGYHVWISHPKWWLIGIIPMIVHKYVVT